MNVLVTAFEPYGEWELNASWLALVELTSELPVFPRITTRLYPVDYDEVRRRIAKDLSDNYDYVLHLGQSPGSSAIALESIAVNVSSQPGQTASKFGTLVEDGPVAYQSAMPLASLAQGICDEGVPAHVSFHAGTYLCNAALYFTQHQIATKNLPTQATFVHLPLAMSQVVNAEDSKPALPSSVVALGLRRMLMMIGEYGSQLA